METSCLKNTNVSNAFETLIELTNIETKRGEEINKKFKLKNEKKSCPC